MNNLMRRGTAAFDRFLFHSCDPRTCVLIRIGFALLLMIYTAVLLRDGVMWFSGEGVLTAATAEKLNAFPVWSFFHWGPDSPFMVRFGLIALMIHGVALLVGFYSRWQAIAIFFWIVSFQFRNPMLNDGEDTLFRLFAFFLIFLPLDYAWSLGKRYPVTSWFRRKPAADCVISDAERFQTGQQAAWGLRLFQCQMTLIYLSAVWCKLLGSAWRDGSALFYVYQMEDLFGRGPIPSFVTESPLLIQLMTWAVLIGEAGLPFALWFRPTRKIAVILGITLHLSMEYSMHLFLFQWIMILGLLSFLPVKQPTFEKPIEVAATS